jgi:hypothetical protein
VGELWHAATVLRELRGDGHVLAQLAVGLDGLTTMVLRCGHDMTREVLQPNRGWGDLEWDIAGERLTERGLLDRDGRITDRGLDTLARAEEITDRLAHEPWDVAGPDLTARFVELASPLAQAARAELPEVTPLGLPS